MDLFYLTFVLPLGAILSDYYDGEVDMDIQADGIHCVTREYYPMDSNIKILYRIEDTILGDNTKQYFTDKFRQLDMASMDIIPY